MPVTSRITAPATQIFTSDPLEQIFARDMFSGNKGGLAAMMLNAAGDTRNADQSNYMAGLRHSNDAAFQLEQLQEALKFRTEQAKAAASLAPHGFLPSTLSGAGDIFNGNAAAGDPAAKLIQALTQAKIAQANSAAANAGAGNNTTNVVYGPDGVPNIQTSTKGGSPEDAIRRVVALRKAAEANGLIPPGGGMNSVVAAQLRALHSQPNMSQ